MNFTFTFSIQSMTDWDEILGISRTNFCMQMRILPHIRVQSIRSFIKSDIKNLETTST